MLYGPDPENSAPACYPCAPYFGRIAGGRFARGGESFHLAANNPVIDAVDPIHGEAWLNPWRVTDQGPHAIAMTFEYRPASAGRWPFAFTCTQSIALSARGIEMGLALRNDHHAPAPAGLALHPFFPRHGDTRLAFSASRLWVPPMHGQEGAFEPIPADGPGHGRASALPAGGLDHSFQGLAGDVSIDGGGRGGNMRALRLSTDAPHVHVYAPPDGDFFCLEAITHLPGRLTGGAPQDGFADILQPGDECALALRIDIV